MVKASRGLMARNTRRLTGKNRATVCDFVKVFEVGKQVVISPQAYYQLGIPALRYTNKVGTVLSRKGESYVVEIGDGKKIKQITAHPIHLKSVL